MPKSCFANAKMQRYKNAKCKFLEPDTESISSLKEKICDTLNYHNYQTINYHNKKYFEKKKLIKMGTFLKKVEIIQWTSGHVLHIGFSLIIVSKFAYFIRICSYKFLESFPWVYFNPPESERMY